MTGNDKNEALQCKGGIEQAPQFMTCATASSLLID